MTTSAIALEQPAGDRAERFTLWALLGVTWLLMIWGAATRASGAGISCPDWPLCHGYVVPPLDSGAYPADPLYRVDKVYLEFVHRALASLVSVGAVTLSVLRWRKGLKRSTVWLLGLLGAQVAMGAVTVLLKNAPYTVVIHLSLALTFLATLVWMRQGTPETLPASGTHGRRLLWLLAIAVTQVLIGGVVSSRGIGLACFDFPLCNGQLIPDSVTFEVAWQLTHRTVATCLVVGACLLWLPGVAAPADGQRRRAMALLGTLAVQVLLGAMNVWFQIPPWVSAMHLGTAAVLVALIVDGVAQAARQARA